MEERVGPRWCCFDVEVTPCLRARCPVVSLSRLQCAEGQRDRGKDGQACAREMATRLPRCCPVATSPVLPALRPLLQPPLQAPKLRLATDGRDHRGRAPDSTHPCRGAATGPSNRASAGLGRAAPLERYEVTDARARGGARRPHSRVSCRELGCPQPLRHCRNHKRMLSAGSKRPLCPLSSVLPRVQGCHEPQSRQPARRPHLTSHGLPWRPCKRQPHTKAP